MTGAANRPKNVAIIGGGITGATAAWKLSQHDDVTVHLFDQGRRGVGGRTSSRSAVVLGAGGDNERDPVVKFDHGCQFFRADTPRFRDIVCGAWRGCVREWRGDFRASAALPPDREFFGLPSAPPFWVGADGMQGLARGVLDLATGPAASASSLRVIAGTRVAGMERGADGRWRLRGTTGAAAFHDTPEHVARRDGGAALGAPGGYDAVLLTDVSSSFGGWHRASAGVPEEFAMRVRERVGARTPLLSAMVAFDGSTGIPFDAASFDDPVVWFAARSNSKPGMMEAGQRECWTLVSTPEYALAQIEETPMQDPTTGAFVPQSAEYLTAVAADLLAAFCALLLRGDGRLGAGALPLLPPAAHADAQRWGSALPGGRRGDGANDADDAAPTRRTVAGVPYDAGRRALAPTRDERDEEGQRSFVADDHLMLFQAGDMVSVYTPGLESAALSGLDAAEYLYGKLHTS